MSGAHPPVLEWFENGRDDKEMEELPVKKITLLILFVMAMCLAGSFSAWAVAFGMPQGVSMVMGAALGIVSFFFVSGQLRGKLTPILFENELPAGKYAKVSWQRINCWGKVPLPLSGGVAILMPLPVERRNTREGYVVTLNEEPPEVFRKGEGRVITEASPDDEE